MMGHTLHKYQHTSRKTPQVAQHPSLDEWGWQLPTSGSSHPSPLQESLLFPKAQWASLHCHGNKVAWTFQREGNSTHSGPTCSIERMALSANEWQGQHSCWNTALQEYTVYSVIWNEIMWLNNIPPGILDNKKWKMEEENHRNNPFLGKGLFHSGKISNVL